MSVRVVYHHEEDSWWADSPDLPGFVAVGADLAEVRELVKTGVPFYAEDEQVEIEEEAPWPGAVVATYRVEQSWGAEYNGHGDAVSSVGGSMHSYRPAARREYYPSRQLSA